MTLIGCVLMTSFASIARAMIIGMIIIRRRPGHGHVA
jgi:hypothetical protein